MRKARGFGYWWILLALVPINAPAAGCTKAEAIAAETDASMLKSWDAVHESFQKYGHCDDGAIAEGYSDAVALLLANNWNTLPSLAKWVAADPSFERFVLRHIDPTAAAKHLTKIASNAKLDCPGEHRILCDHLLKAVEAAGPGER